MEDFFAGALVAIIAGSFTFLATNFKELWRSRDISVTRKGIKAGLAFLRTTTITNPDEPRIKNAVTDITEKSTRENYPSCIDCQVREDLAHFVGKKGGTAAVEFLSRALKDKDEDVRIAAVTALSGISGARIVQLLFDALRDKSVYVRWKAAEALGKMRDFNFEDIAPILYVLEDHDSVVRRAAAEALGEIRSATATSYLVRGLKDDKWYVRREAAKALGKIKDKGAVPDLIRASKDVSDADVRAAAVDALKPFIDPTQDNFDPRAREAVYEAVNDKDPLVKQLAIRRVAAVDTRAATKTPGQKNVLVLGGFGGERKKVFDVIEKELHSNNYICVRPDEGPDDTTSLQYLISLASKADFVIADLSEFDAFPLDWAEMVRQMQVPWQPIQQEGKEITGQAISSLSWYPNKFLPVYNYKDYDDLAALFKERVLAPALEKLT